MNHPRRVRRLSFVAAAMAVALLVAACGGSSSPSSAGHSSGAGGSAGGSTSQYLGWSPCCSWGTTWSYNMYSPYALGILNNLVYLPLAAEDVPSLTRFTPLLASSWSVNGQNITVHIRPGLRWQNGRPVTSKDVYDTWLLYGTDGDYGWGTLSNLRAPNSRTVIFTVANGIPTTLAEDNIFGGYVYPSSLYGKFITPSLKADVLAYNNMERRNPAAATKMVQYTHITKVFQTLSSAKISQSQINGDGPYTLTGINTSQAKMVKWSGYYDAKNIHLPGIDYYNQPNQGIYPQLLSGTADFSNVYLPPNIIQEWQRKGGHIAVPLAWSFNLQFNNSTYPLNMEKVRQALAYVLPRDTITAAAYGTLAKAGGVVSKVPAGIAPWLADLYLTPGQISALNPYNTNDAKATRLLDSSGFHKSGSHWIMPNGKPFTLSFLANSATTDITATFTSASKALEAFGIKASVDATSGATVTADLYGGSYEIGYTGCGGYNPLSAFACMLGTGNNFLTLGSYAGKRGLGFGPTVNVPDLGTVNVHTISSQAASVGPGPQMKKLTWDWARLVNEQVPYISYATKVYQFSYSTQKFTDFPPLNAKGTSPLWDIMANNMEQGLLVFLNQGYIRPKG